MITRQLHKLLRELTPEIRAYLFPGMPFEVALPEEGITAESSCKAPMCYDMAVEARPAPAAGAKMKSACQKHHSVSDSIPEEERLDPRTELILAEIRRLQEKYDVSIDELEILLGYTVKLSRLYIARSGKIFLSDYDNKEVRMPNVAKALFFLYLRHPEGLRFKDVADHKEELVRIYSNITGRDEPEEIEKSIDLLVDPFGNALNVNASRIKTAFRNAVSDRIARFYYINGAAGDVKKVPLDRDLVIWEY